MRLKIIIALILAAATFLFTTRMIDGSMCFFRFGDAVPGFCGAPLLYYLGFAVAAAIVVWEIVESLLRWRGEAKSLASQPVAPAPVATQSAAIPPSADTPSAGPKP